MKQNLSDEIISFRLNNRIFVLMLFSLSLKQKKVRIQLSIKQTDFVYVLRQ